MKRTAAVIVSTATLLAGLATAQAQPAAQGQPAARVGTADVSIAELDALAAERLTKVRNEEYQIRRQVLEGLIERRLIEVEAKARGVSSADLEKAEITSKVEAVTSEQARAVLDSAPEKYATISQEQALSQIATALQRTRIAAARRGFLVAARKKHGVTVFLDAPKVSIDSSGAPTKGPAEAPITMVTFSDFQCPYCVRVNPTLKALETKYAGKLRIAFKDFPLGIHKEARKAAEAGQCAAEQGKFWEMHDKMFANQQKLQTDSLKSFAKEIGLDGSAFASCLDSGRTAARVAADVAQGTRHGVTGTPTFFINGRFLSGAQSIEKFSEIIDEELESRSRPSPVESPRLLRAMITSVRSPLLLLLAATTAVACGGGSGPSAPSTPPPAAAQTITVTSGETATPLAGVRLTTGGTGYTTNQAGQVSLPGTQSPSDPIDIEAPAFLKRETTLARGPQFSLWPTQALGATESWTQQALHGTFGTSPMQRPDPQLMQYTIIPTATLAADSSSVAALERAAAMWNAATASLGFTMRLGSGAPLNAPGVVVATIDPSLLTAGGAAPLGTGRALSGGTISFRSVAAARLPNIVAHELGHMFGMAHSSDPVDIMFSASPPADLSAREQLTARLMLQRRPGKTWPDNERATSVQSLPGSFEVASWLCGPVISHR